MRERSCVVGKVLVFTRMSQHCAFRREWAAWILGLWKADEHSLFQMSQAPVPAGRCPPLMGGSHTIQIRTAPWRRVTSTPCQTLRVIRTLSGPRYLCLAVLSEGQLITTSAMPLCPSFVFLQEKVLFPKGLFR